MSGAVEVVQWAVLGYFVVLHLGYLLLDGSAIVALLRDARDPDGELLPAADLSLAPPVSVLVPAFNERATVVSTVRALLGLAYSQHEVVVVNDGSTDDTLARLTAEFSLVPFPEAYRVRLATRPVRAVYRSTTHPNLRVVDKENGGKSDALNAGINAARYPLFCSVDADSVLQRESLARAVRPFLEDAATVAVGGTVRLANGCTIVDGFVEKVGLPRSPLALLQVVEYLRSFLFGRLGWSPLNALMVISGAFGVFRKDVVLAAGGYRTDTVGEDMELVMRLHRHCRAEGRDYRIVFIADPICWTEVPERLGSLGRQRIRWQRGLTESLSANRRLLRGRHGGPVKWLSYPFTLLFECVGPVIELFGYGFFVAGALFGFLSPEAAVAFLVVSIGLGMTLSVSALLLEEISFHVYPGARYLVVLFGVAVVENFGYRQLTTLWQLVGLVRWAAGRGRGRAEWGHMERSAAWQSSGRRAAEDHDHPAPPVPVAATAPPAR